MKILAILPIFIATVFVSCSSDDTTPNVLVIPVEVPVDYTFTRNNVSTVFFSGQTTRILMAEEIISAFNDQDNASQSSLQAMFDHQVGAVDFGNTSLNESGKNARSKAAASTDFFSANATEATAIKVQFDAYINSQTQEVFPNWNTAASAGVAGQIADGSSTRYVSAEGLEYNQVFAKGLIGALMTDQIINNYLSASVLDAESNVENNNNDVLDGDEPYTTMEHKWDEGYGYLFGTATDLVNPVSTIGEADSFLNKYVGKVESDTNFEGIAQEIFDAFKLGRAAIVAKNYEVRNAQAAILQQKISEVIAIRAIYYLQNGKMAIENNSFGAAFHDLSEGYGFLTSLRFTRDIATGTALFTKSEVDGFVADLMNDGANGLWDVTPATLDAISEAIAAKFSFTVAQAASTN
jgi:hypothetical protein